MTPRSVNGFSPKVFPGVWPMRSPRFAPSVVAVALLTATIRCEELPTHALARLGTAGALSGDEYAAVAVSADGKYHAAGSYGGPLRAWDFATGKAIDAPASINGRVISLAFLSDNKTLLIGGGARVQTWDATGTDTW